MKLPKASMIAELKVWNSVDFCTKEINFLTGIDMQRPNSFELLIVFLYRISQIVYIIVNYPKNLYVLLFLLHGNFYFNGSVVWSEFLFHIVNIYWKIFRKIFYSSIVIVGKSSMSIYLWIRLFMYVRFTYKHDSASWIKREPWPVFPTIYTLIVSRNFHELRCSTIWYPVKLYPTLMCFTFVV